MIPWLFLLSLLNGVPYVPYVLYIPKFPRALRALRAHAPYVPYVSTRLSIFYRPENQKMETLYPYVFKGTEFSFGP